MNKLSNWICNVSGGDYKLQAYTLFEVTYLNMLLINILFFSSNKINVKLREGGRERGEN